MNNKIFSPATYRMLECKKCKAIGKWCKVEDDIDCVNVICECGGIINVDKPKKKILYNHWNYLSDKIGISSPDGGAFYCWSIFQEFMKRDWDVCCLVDRDMQLVMKYKEEAFASFSKEKRYKIYKDIDFVLLSHLPDELDILFLEWRWPMPNNQLDKMDENYSPDLKIQNKILDFYKDKNVKLIIFDLDYKLTASDELKIEAMGYKNVVVLETALFPKKSIFQRKSVFIPFDFSEMNQFPTILPNRNKRLIYLGNNYDRKFDFETKLIPYSNKYPNKVHLIGNWLGDKNKEFREQNPNIVYRPRISFNDFHKNIKNAVAMALLAKEDYKMSGFMTARILETLLFGIIPVGFSDFRGIETFLPKELIVNMDNYEESMDNVMNRLIKMDLKERDELRQSLIQHLSKLHSAENFVNVVLGVKNG